MSAINAKAGKIAAFNTKLMDGCHMKIVFAEEVGDQDLCRIWFWISDKSSFENWFKSPDKTAIKLKLPGAGLSHPDDLSEIEVTLREDWFSEFAEEYYASGKFLLCL